MKYIIIVLYTIFLVFNLTCYLLLDSYTDINIIVTSAVIVVGALFMLLVHSQGLSIGHKISLTFLFPTITLVEYFAAVSMPKDEAQKYYILAIIAMAFMQIAIYCLTNFITEKNKKNECLS